MIRSLLLSLTAETSYPILGSLGRPAQAWFLRQMAHANPSLAQRLHDEKGVKPYTVSTLLDERGCPLQSGTWLQPGQICWLRLSTFNEELSTVLEKQVIKDMPKSLTIYKMGFRVDGVAHTRAEHPWAGETSFSEMAQDTTNAKATNTVRMEFTSPTAFRNNNLDVCLPVPGQIFRSLGNRWNAFCPEPMQLQDIWPDFAGACIFVNELTAVNTIHWAFAKGTRGAATGFTGIVGFHLPAEKILPEKWQPYYEGAATVMQSLAHFAFYAGVGHHTTIGMGQTRLLAPEISAQRKGRSRRSS